MDIKDFKNIHEGKIAYILGNGPSLNDISLGMLDDEITFGTNRIYLSGWTPKYHVCVNPLVLNQFGGEIKDVEATRIVPIDFAESMDAVGIDTSLRDPDFSSPEGPIWEGYTVTYVCLQLAYYMGIRNVILLGVDHDYGKEGLRPNLEIISTKPDEHHFDPDYFGRGVRWNAPDLAMSEFAYSLAKYHYEKAGGWIYNASTKTKLDVFPLANPFWGFLGTTDEPKVSAIVSAYKAEDYLKGLIGDLNDQTLNVSTDLEVVFICQKDSKEFDIIKNADKKFLRQIILTDDIPTVYKAWNLGIKAAWGKYITNANTDDRHHPKAYETMAKVLDTRPDIDLVYHDCFITWKPNQTYEEFIRENSGKRLLASGRVEGEPGVFSWMDYSKSALHNGCFIGPQPMWRASLHKKYGYFIEQYKSAGDYEFWLRIAKENNMLHIRYPFGLYLARPDGIELGNLQLNAEESFTALVMNQTVDMYMRGMDKNNLLVTMGDEYVVADVDQFQHQLGQAVKEVRGE